MPYKEHPTILSATDQGVTTATSDVQQNNEGSRFGWLTIIVSAIAGGGSLTVALEMQEPVSGVWFSCGQLAAAVTTATTVRLWMGDSTVSGSTGFTTSLARPFPMRWRASVANAAGTASYTVHAVTF